MNPSSSQLRKGDAVLVVEGPHQGLLGKITSIYKAWRDGSSQRVVAIEDVSGAVTEVRQAFVRIDRPAPGAPPARPKMPPVGHTTTESPEGAARREAVAAAAPPAVADKHLLEVLARHNPALDVSTDTIRLVCWCGEFDDSSDTEDWLAHIKRVEKLH
jgi:hypothetical protein